MYIIYINISFLKKKKKCLKTYTAIQYCMLGQHDIGKKKWTPQYVFLFSL